MKTLVVFDFDDTLFKSGSRIAVKRNGAHEKFLSSHEYAEYSPSAEESFDFSEFEKYPRLPEPISKTVKKLEDHVRRYGLDNVIILTARGVKDPVERVLENFNLPPVFVAAVGTSNPSAKSEYVRRTIEEEGYDKIILYEDSEKNIDAIIAAVESTLGRGRCKAFRVIKCSKVVQVTEGRLAPRFSKLRSRLDLL